MAKIQVTIHQAKTSLSSLIQKALSGAEIVIAKRDVPLVELKVIKPKKRQSTCSGIWISAKQKLLGQGPCHHSVERDFRLGAFESVNKPNLGYLRF
jgi:antitoxin (DNA-binding transcriptional repressor) of toxin-antitoxin stability system